MMPCRTATITYRETRQVTDGSGPVLAERCAVVTTFFALPVPQLLQGPDTDLRCGICWEPRFVEPPPSKVLLLASFQGCLLGNSGSNSSHWPPLKAQEAPEKGQGLPMLAMPTKARGGGVLYP